MLTAILATAALAHPGGLDASGGHANRKTGEYHYHRRPSTGQTQTVTPQSTSTEAPKKQPAKRAAPVDLQANGMYYVQVTRVIDRDTLEVTFENGQKEKVRLIGVYTPETVHPKKAVQRYGKEASHFTKTMLTDASVWLQMDVGLRDKYQRILAYVWTDRPVNADNKGEVRRKMFNAKLLLEGYAQVMTIQPNSRYAELFVQFQEEAREGRKGLWKE